MDERVVKAINAPLDSPLGRAYQASYQVRQRLISDVKKRLASWGIDRQFTDEDLEFVVDGLAEDAMTQVYPLLLFREEIKDVMARIESISKELLKVKGVQT